MYSNDTATQDSAVPVLKLVGGGSANKIDSVNWNMKCSFKIKFLKHLTLLDTLSSCDLLAGLEHTVYKVHHNNKKCVLKLQS